jgi:hypothetical protein
MCARF